MEQDSVFYHLDMESITKSLKLLDLDVYDDETLSVRCQRMIEVIPNCQSIYSIMDVMDTLEVNSAGAISITEMKERLILHLHSLTKGTDDLVSNIFFPRTHWHT